MAAGLPTKANWASLDALTAAQMNDLAGTVNSYVAPLASPTFTGAITYPKAPASPPLTQNRYVRSSGSVSSSALTQSVEYASPVFFHKAVTLNRLGVAVTATAASSTIRLGIRNDSDGVPGTVVLDAGTIDSASTTGEFFITISQALSPGWYWFTATPQGGAPSANIITAHNAYISGHTSYNTGFTGNQNAFTQTGVTGALGSTFTISNINFGVVVVARVA